MNVIFGIILIVSMTMLLFLSPESVLSAFIAGGEKALIGKVAFLTALYIVLVPVLGLFFGKRTYYPVNRNSVENIDHMIDNYQYHRDPADVVKVCLSHICTTFANNFNIFLIIKK